MIMYSQFIHLSSISYKFQVNGLEDKFAQDEHICIDEFFSKNNN